MMIWLKYVNGGAGVPVVVASPPAPPVQTFASWEYGQAYIDEFAGSFVDVIKNTSHAWAIEQIGGAGAISPDSWAGGAGQSAIRFSAWGNNNGNQIDCVFRIRLVDYPAVFADITVTQWGLS